MNRNYTIELIFVLFFKTTNVFPYDFKVDGLCYNILTDNTVELTINVDYLGRKYYAGDVVVPSFVSINDSKYEVVSIGEGAFAGSSELTSIIIPNSIKSIKDEAFYGCHKLTSIIIPSSVTTIGPYAFQYCSALTSIIIPSSITILESQLFQDCYALSSITIPNTITAMNAGVFRGCRSLTSITIPQSVKRIEREAFSGCLGLIYIHSEIVNPFIIDEADFSDYSKPILIVPRGKKSVYQLTPSWNKFSKIVESSDVFMMTKDGIIYKGNIINHDAEVLFVDANILNVDIPSFVSYDSRSYFVTSIDNEALNNRVLNYVSLPSSVNKISDNTFKNSTLGALIWNADIALSSSVFTNMAMPIESNLLLFINSKKYAPDNVRNVITNGVASLITLSDDGGNFFCPQAFTTKKITYTHNYSMETGGLGKGWDTIALPFDVQSITHSNKGELIPFASFNLKSDKKPFWLYQYIGGSFQKATSIQANKPYLISMPNQASYNKEYILSGNVIFSAENVSIPVTPEPSGIFVPTYSQTEKSNAIKVLNVVNKNATETGGYDAGSRFISNLRDVCPFECYFNGSTSTRSVEEMIEDE